MPDPEVRRIVRQWDREIDAERRREAGRREPAPWRIVSWLALWLLWLGALVMVLELIRPSDW